MRSCRECVKAWSERHIRVKKQTKKHTHQNQNESEALELFQSDSVFTFHAADKSSLANPPVFHRALQISSASSPPRVWPKFISLLFLNSRQITFHQIGWHCCYASLSGKCESQKRKKEMESFKGTGNFKCWSFLCVTREFLFSSHVGDWITGVVI